MKEVKDKHGIHIDITNACRFSCANCYKFVGHYARPYFMELKTVKKAIDSLEGYQGHITITGGEPTLHPDFSKICSYFRKKIPTYQRCLQTTGYKWHEYKPVIKKTFGYRVQYNDHNDLTEKHHPMLVAIKDVVTDATLRRKLIDKCWVREDWSAVINVNGCYSCEVAGAFDVLHNGNKGLPIEKGWWTKGHEHFKEQLERYCCQCGAALPQSAITIESNNDNVSISNFRMLEKLGTPKFKENRIMLTEKICSEVEIDKISETWKPSQHVGEKGYNKNSLAHLSVSNFLLRVRLSFRYRYKMFRKLDSNIMNLIWRLNSKVD